MSYKVKDHYFKKAKSENYVARSVYKLEEIQKKYKVIRKGQRVLDLGASPGSWSQYLSKEVGEEGLVIGVDLQLVTVGIPNFHFLQKDVYELSLEEDIYPLTEKRPLNLVVSDMAPKTTGVKMADQARSFQLCEKALFLAESLLGRGGHFVCKFFQSNEFGELKKQMAQSFERVAALKPNSTRSSSKEIFLIGMNKKSR